jgi:hypothetical protein
MCWLPNPAYSQRRYRGAIWHCLEVVEIAAKKGMRLVNISDHGSATPT